MYKLISLLFIFSSLISCGDNKGPVYLAKSNTYTFWQMNSSEIQLLNNSKIYTYTTESLETNYEKIFCGNLQDCSFNINNIKNSTLFGNFNLDTKPIVNNSLGIKSINLYRLIYTTLGQFGEKRKVSGALFVPNIDPHKIKGIILFFHPTVFDKHSVPSYAATQKSDQVLAAIFVAQGYIVAAPDYIGLGYDESMVHPYILYPQINALDGLAMLIASQQFLTQKKLFNHQKLPLYITGSSEGGAYALWFSRLYQEQSTFKILINSTNFNVTKIVPISGAYDLSGVMYNYLFSDINIFNKSKFNVANVFYAAKLKSSLFANAMLAYSYYTENGNFSKVFNPNFFNMICTFQLESSCQFMGKQINLLEAFSQNSTLDIAQKVSNAAAFKIANKTIFINQFNSVVPLINPNLLKNSQFMSLLTNGDIYYWHSTVPTTIVYFKHDSIVSNYNSLYAYTGMLANNSTNLTQIPVNNAWLKRRTINYLPAFDVDHGASSYYLLIIALNQFNQFK